MAKHHDPSSGVPYADADESVGEFAPKGEPEKLNLEPVQVPKTDADEALEEFSATKAGGTCSSVTGHGREDVPFDGPAGGRRPELYGKK